MALSHWIVGCKQSFDTAKTTVCAGEDWRQAELRAPGSLGSVAASHYQAQELPPVQWLLAISRARSKISAIGPCLVESREGKKNGDPPGKTGVDEDYVSLSTVQKPHDQPKLFNKDMLDLHYFNMVKIMLTQRSRQHKDSLLSDGKMCLLESKRAASGISWKVKIRFRITSSV